MRDGCIRCTNWWARAAVGETTRILQLAESDMAQAQRRIGQRAAVLRSKRWGFQRSLAETGTESGWVVLWCVAVVPIVYQIHARHTPHRRFTRLGSCPSSPAPLPPPNTKSVQPMCAHNYQRNEGGRDICDYKCFRCLRMFVRHCTCVVERVSSFRIPMLHCTAELESHLCQI